MARTLFRTKIMILTYDKIRNFRVKMEVKKFKVVLGFMPWISCIHFQDYPTSIKLSKPSCQSGGLYDCLRLLSCSCGLQSQAHLHLFQFEIIPYLLLDCYKNKNIQKEAGIGSFFSTKTSLRCSIFIWRHKNQLRSFQKMFKGDADLV